jgi:hypothetical protein
MLAAATERDKSFAKYARKHQTVPTLVPTHFVAVYPQLSVAQEAIVSLRQAVDNSAGSTPHNFEVLVEQVMAIFFFFKQMQVKTAGEDYPTVPLAVQGQFSL